MAIENIDDLTALIENDPAAVREALELIKRTLPNYPVASAALDDDALALYKDASGGTEQLQIATLLLRTIENSGGVKSLEAGAIADRPTASTAGADAFFLSTDEPVLYRSDGADWESVLSVYTSFVDSVSDLRSGSWQGDNLYLSGYYGVGTSGGGPLYRDSADTTTADNGGTVFVDADGVRWKRPDSFHISTSEFGIQADAGASVSGDINSMIQATPDDHTIMFDEPGEYLISDTVEFDKAGHRVEIAEGVTFKLADGSLTGTLEDASIFEIYADDVSVEGGYFDGNKSGNGTGERSSCIYISQGNRITVRDVVCDNSTRHGILIAGDRGVIQDATVENISGSGLARDLISVAGPSQGACYNVTIDGVTYYGSDNRGAVEICDGSTDVFCSNVYAENCLYGVHVEDHTAANQDCENIHISHVIAHSSAFGVILGSTSGTLTHRNIFVDDVVLQDAVDMASNGKTSRDSGIVWVDDINRVFLSNLVLLRAADNTISEISKSNHVSISDVFLRVQNTSNTTRGVSFAAGDGCINVSIERVIQEDQDTFGSGYLPVAIDDVSRCTVTGCVVQEILIGGSSNRYAVVANVADISDNAGDTDSVVANNVNY